MDTITIDGMDYPTMVNNTTTPQKLKEMLRRVGEFGLDQTQKQKTTLRHLEEGVVEFMEIGNGLALYLTPDQKHQLETMD